MIGRPEALRHCCPKTVEHGIRLQLFVSACLLCLSLQATSCGSAEPPLEFYLLSGTITSSTVDASGSWTYLRLVEFGGELSSPPLYVASCQLIGPACDYQINQVVEGQYTVFGVIDRNDDASPVDPLPEMGDLFSPGRPLTMFGRQQLDFPDEAWREMP